MIRKLQIKFIAVMMGVLLLVFGAIFITLNVFMRVNSTQQTEELLRTVVENDGIDFARPDGPPDDEGLRQEDGTWRHRDNRGLDIRSVRFFYVKFDSDGEVLDAHYDMIVDMTRQEALTYAKQVLESGKKQGTDDTFQYMAADKDYGKIVVFAEKSIEMRLLSQLIRVSVIVLAVSVPVLLLFAFLLSRWAIRPVQSAFDKQRRFISDASHELKTPLTIILANADILGSAHPDNVQLSYIRGQGLRMKQLIHDLLELARLDESSDEIHALPFDISRMVENTVLEFESLAFEAGRTLTFTIAPDITCSGEEPKLKQLVTILLDNAIKHSDERGEIGVELRRDRNRILLSVTNTGGIIQEEDREKIFERFYRSDDSRSRQTGGYGLGLAIAKSIVQAHHGRITAGTRPDGRIEFLVVL